MPTAFVTGARGFTGRYLVPLLNQQGYDVHGLVRPDESAPQGDDAHWHTSDLGDFDSLRAAVAQARPDVVVHLAGIAFVGHTDAAEIYQSNLLGTRNLLQSILAAGANPRSVLLASSANVYGNQQGGALSEDAPLQPINEYGISKAAMEMVARLFMDRMPITIARPFNYTGVGQSTDFVVPKIVDHSRRRTGAIQLGNIDVERDFSDVRGVCSIYARLLETPEAAGKIVNICSGRPHSMRAVLGLVEELTGHRMIVEHNPALMRANEVLRLYGDKSRLEQLLGPMTVPNLHETLSWMLEA